jgi:hypothetical protein
VTPRSLTNFVDAARRGDLQTLHALVDWEETGRRRVRESAADLAGEAGPDVVDDAVRRGLDESRRAVHDIDLATPYLVSLLDRLGPIRATRPATDEAPADDAWIVEGDEELVVAGPPDADRVVILGWRRDLP